MGSYSKLVVVFWIVDSSDLAGGIVGAGSQGAVVGSLGPLTVADDLVDLTVAVVGC
jgi:hypothetical protein